MRAVCSASPNPSLAPASSIPERRHDDLHEVRRDEDHCHDSGTVRGLLCMNCNAGLGNLGDSPTLLRKGADYLEAAA